MLEGILLGMLIGSVFGFTVAALCQAAKDDHDDWDDWGDC